MKNKPSIIALSLLILLSAGCDWRGVRGNGTIKTEQRPVTDFTRVDAGGFYDIEWRPGSPSLRLTTDENLLANIETKMEGDVLKIETRGQIAPTHGVEVAITSPSLAGAELSGAVEFEATQLSGDRFAIETSGATKITLAGRANRLIASLTGASRLDAETFQSGDVEIQSPERGERTSSPPIRSERRSLARAR